MSSTVYALNKGAVEANPIFAGMSMPWFVAVKLAIILLVWKYHDTAKEDEWTFVNVLTCGAAVNNIMVVQ